MNQQIEQWRTIELSFESESVYDNPYTDVAITAVFTGPNGENISRPAFWDGGQVWKIRFAPISLGEWNYTVTASDTANGSLNNIAGAIDCVAYTGDLDIYKKGFIKKADGKPYLTYADGTPFFWVGDTHWYFCLLERWDESNKEGIASQFKGIVDKRVQQGFNVYQCNLDIVNNKNDGGGYFEEGQWFTKVNTDYFQNNVDLKMSYIADNGFVNAFGFSWWDVVDDNVEGMQRFATYMIARYGSYPIIWTMSGEVAGYDPTMYDQRIADWREVALHVQAMDGYNSLRTAHDTNERPLPTYYENDSWYDFKMNQMGHGNLPVNTDYYDEYRAEHPNRPLIESEIFYEGLLTLEYISRRDVSPVIMRLGMYRALQSGCCGYTYGAQGIWNAKWDAAVPDDFTREGDYFGTYDWRTAIDAPGADHVTNMKKLYTSLPWWELKPNSNLQVIPDYIGGKIICVSANEDLSIVLAYYPETTTTSPNQYKLVPNSTYQLQVFDPVTGNYLHDSKIQLDDTGILSPPDFDEGYEDMAIVMKKI